MIETELMIVIVCLSPPRAPLEDTLFKKTLYIGYMYKIRHRTVFQQIQG